MKKLLLTAFEPFGGDELNSSLMTLERLPNRIGPWEITKLTLPVVFGKAADIAIAASEELQPNAILCLGQAANRAEVTPEFVGLNFIDARIPDNAGRRPQREPIAEDGPAAYFSTLPVFEIAEAIRAAGTPSSVSFSAGTYVCNDLLYSLLHRYGGEGLPIGFIHLPLAKEQATADLPAMELADMVLAITRVIESIETI